MMHFAPFHELHPTYPRLIEWSYCARIGFWLNSMEIERWTDVL
jgi:hypothetical protein